MTSEPIRDPVADDLLTPQNAAFIIIDYQPVQVNSIASMDRQLLVNNIVGTAKAAVAYGLPIVHSTVNVKTGLNKPPIGDRKMRWPGAQPYHGSFHDLFPSWKEYWERDKAGAGNDSPVAEPAPLEKFIETMRRGHPLPKPRVRT